MTDIRKLEQEQFDEGTLCRVTNKEITRSIVVVEKDPYGRETYTNRNVTYENGEKIKATETELNKFGDRLQPLESVEDEQPDEEMEVVVEEGGYHDMTYQELQSIARDSDLSGYSGMNKAELADFLEAELG